MKTTATEKASPRPDHRIEVAARRREQMRARLLNATLAVFTRDSGAAPGIEDVVRSAKVSRGTFYLYFQTLDEALQALVQEQSDQMTRVALPIYEVLKEPWQRFAVGFRLFLKRASSDSRWALFMNRSILISGKQLMTAYMQEDLRRGKELGQFAYAELEVAMDVEMSSLVAGIRSLGIGVSHPETYMDESVRMALTGLGCAGDLCERSVRFSREYLDGWSWSRTDERGSQFGPSTLPE